MMIRSNVLFKYVSNGTLAAALVIGGIALLRTWQLFSRLPPGTCPMVHYRPWIYTALVLSLVSLGFSFMETRFRNRNHTDEVQPITDSCSQTRPSEDDTDRSD